MVKVKAVWNELYTFEISCFNHPMVKVKESEELQAELQEIRFNHPMVKVKAAALSTEADVYSGFNHPMVKVKATKFRCQTASKKVSTTLW